MYKEEIAEGGAGGGFRERSITAWRGRVPIVANAPFIPSPRERVEQCVRESARERVRETCSVQQGLGEKAGREKARAHTHTQTHTHTHAHDLRQRHSAALDVIK